MKAAVRFFIMGETALSRGYKSTKKSTQLCDELAKLVLEKIPGSFIRNESVTTSSVYMKTPDGYSLRIGDHNGKQKYHYKYNLGPQYKGIRGWRKRDGKWSLYTDQIEQIAEIVSKNLESQKLSKRWW